MVRNSLRPTVSRALRAGRSLLSCALVAWSSAVDAQSSASNLEEVVVTARRLSENLQTVPIAITAFSSGRLREDNITSTQDLSMFVPSLAINNNVGFGGGFALRGQGTIEGAPPGVVAYFTEVPLINAQTALGLSQGGLGAGEFFDVTSVDVLKGPQGTLFGRNTTGGAILITPQRPTNSLEGYGQLTTGEYDWREFEGAVNLPVIDDRLLVRLAADVSSRDGYTRDAGLFFPGRDYDNRKYEAVRLSATVKPIQGFENRLILDNYYQDQHGQGGKIVGVNPDSPAAAAFPMIQSFIASQQALGPRYTSLSTYQIDRESRFAAIDIAQWTMTGKLTLRNIAAYQSEKNTLGLFDFDQTRFPIQDASTPNRWAGTGEQFSEELQLSGVARDSSLKWVAGSYFEYARPTDMPEFDVSLPAEVTPGVYLPVKVIAQGATTERSHAVYGQFTYNLDGLARRLEQWKVTGGFRYTWDYAAESSNVFIPTFGNVCVETSGVVPNCLLSPSGRFRAPTWTLGLDYQLTPLTLAYITGRHGYKSGGFNLLTPFHSLYSEYRPEHVTDVELGIKTDCEIAGIEARSNVALFHSDYADVQRSISVNVDGIVAPVNENAASATIEGVEWEQTLRPTTRSELRLSYSYLESKYGRFFSPVEGDLSSEPFPYTPRNKVSISLRYELPLSPRLGNVSLSTTYAYQSTMNGQVRGSYEEVAAYALLNLRVDALDLAGSGFDASIFVTNATNKVYVTRLSEAYMASGTAGVTYGEPRIIGGQLRYRFGR